MRSALPAILCIGILAAALGAASAQGLIGCSHAYAEHDHFCVLDDGGCGSLLIVATEEDGGSPSAWYAGSHDAAFYDRPGYCDNYGVESCDHDKCFFVAFGGMGNDGPLPELGDVLPTVDVGDSPIHFTDLLYKVWFEVYPKGVSIRG